MIRGNRITNCGNAGIRIWRDDAGPDGSIITGNRIGKIDWKDGGNGQNGNGMSIYKADDVIVSDNMIDELRVLGGAHQHRQGHARSAAIPASTRARSRSIRSSGSRAR